MKFTAGPDPDGRRTIAGPSAITFGDAAKFAAPAAVRAWRAASWHAKCKIEGGAGDRSGDGSDRRRVPGASRHH